MFHSLFSRPDLITSAGGSGQGFTYRANNYTDLTTAVAPTATDGELAYVRNSEGTWYLPFEYGGTYHSKGVYIWTDGVGWNQDRDEILLQIEINKNHLESTSNPHLTTIANLNDTTVAALLDGSFLQYSQAAGKWLNVKDIIIDGNIEFNGSIAFGPAIEIIIDQDYNNLIIPNLGSNLLVKLIMDGNHIIRGITVPDQTKGYEIGVTVRGAGIASFRDRDPAANFENQLLMGANKTIQQYEGGLFIYDTDGTPTGGSGWQGFGFNI